MRGTLCPKCGQPQEKEGLCASCLSNPPAFKLMRSWAAFDDPIRPALHKLKYRRNLALGDALAAHLARFVESLEWPVDNVVPVPLGNQRFKERGYNQVALIARPLSLALGLTYKSAALRRTRETRSQVGLSAHERRQNVNDAFTADAGFARGRSVLLMDDVATTGSTLSACAGALYKGGASGVYAITMARALPHHSRDIV